jgi:hypothetical protein
MAIRLMSNLPARIIQVLQDYLPAELILIDAEEADGITTLAVPNGQYYEWDQRTIPKYPACSIRIVSSTPIEVWPSNDATGARWIRADHRVDVMFHVILSQSPTGDPKVLQRLLSRYVAGAARVLCVLKESLQTALDTDRYAEITRWLEPAVYGPEEEQEGGEVVRTATLPITVRTSEVR